MHIFVHPRRGGERGRGGEQSRSKGNEWRAVMVSTSINLSHISFLLTSSSRCSGKGRSAYSKHLLWRHWPESEPISRPLGWRLVSIFSSETQALSRSRVSRVSRHDDSPLMTKSKSHSVDQSIPRARPPCPVLAPCLLPTIGSFRTHAIICLEERETESRRARISFLLHPLPLSAPS